MSFLFLFACHYDIFIYLFFTYFHLGNASLISEALRHYQRLENENHSEKIIEKLAKRSDKNRHHYHIKECKIRPIIVHQAVTHKIKVSYEKNINSRHTF